MNILSLLSLHVVLCYCNLILKNIQAMYILNNTNGRMINIGLLHSLTSKDKPLLNRAINKCQRNVTSDTCEMFLDPRFKYILFGVMLCWKVKHF